MSGLTVDDVIGVVLNFYKRFFVEGFEKCIFFYK